jgi:hypothetical protein
MVLNTEGTKRKSRNIRGEKYSEIGEKIDDGMRTMLVVYMLYMFGRYQREQAFHPF